ncbi:MAG: hypothetical protein EXR99_10785 [Gemmataceae bacterium]|nr:hypothetical protein [Gemmataceae bacterium]
MNKQDLYLEFLKEEGYRPTLDDDGDIVFKHEGQTYILFAETIDSSYFRLALPAFWEISSPDEEEKGIHLCMELNAELKVVKVYQLGDKLWAAVEMFCDPVETFKPVLTRCLRVLQIAAGRFRDRMHSGLSEEGYPKEQGYENPSDWSNSDDDPE